MKSWPVRIYFVMGLGLVLVYGLLTAIGFTAPPAPRQQIPASVRHSPGGYRSFHFWHSGFQGGK